MRPHTSGKLNQFLKKVTPYFGLVTANDSTTRFLELVNAYLNCVIGKGSGTGHDKGEELAASRFIKRQIPVILDIGANKGFWTMELRRLIGEQGHWILVDAARECCELLRQIRGVEVIEAAVGEKSGRAKFYTPGDSFGAASLHQRKDSFLAEQKLTFQEREVAVTTIDEIISQRGIEVVDLAKMDIEGHELFALRGAAQALKAQRIRALTFEFGAGNVNSRTFFRDFWDLLTGYGYHLERIYPGGKTVPVTEYYEDLEYFRGVTNYIASPAKS